MSDADQPLADDPMRRMQSGHRDLEIPPPVFVDMEGEILDYVDGESLRVKFPFQTRQRNPMGNMQGGVIVAAIDNTLGPLSYMVAPPSVTTQLTVSYIRPVTPDDSHIYVEGRVEEMTNRWLFLSAHVTNEAGKKIAICHATFLIVGS